MANSSSPVVSSKVGKYAIPGALKTESFAFQVSPVEQLAIWCVSIYGTYCMHLRIQTNTLSRSDVAVQYQPYIFPLAFRNAGRHVA